MNRLHLVPRPFTLPVRLDESSHKGYQGTGSLSTSPLRFQQGFLKIPEGVRPSAIDGSALFRTSLFTSYVLSGHERTITSHPIFPILSELADQETRILQIARVRKQWVVHWLARAGAVFGFTAGAGAIFSLYVLVPALHLSSFPGLLGWERLVPFGMLGLTECTIITIIRKTTIGRHHQYSRLDYLRTAYHRQTFEPVKSDMNRHDVCFLASPNTLPLAS